MAFWKKKELKPELKLEEFIYQVKKELTEAQEKHAGEKAYFELERVELEVTVMVHYEAEGGVNLFVVDAGANIAKEHVHSVKLSFGIAEAKQKASNKGPPINWSELMDWPVVSPFEGRFFIKTKQ